jgi:pyridinium-3,5-bisthiocarboxylic acid mononucleotide nickel chelatase
MPALRIASIGYGAGDRDFAEHANVLRCVIGQASGASESTLISVLEANLDDASPQVLGYAMDRLIAAGALDVSLSPVTMKKNRPGTLLRVLASPGDQEKLAELIFAETPTLGLRIYPAERRVQARSFAEVQTEWGPVRIKVAANGEFAPEYEDCRVLAEKSGVPLRKVLAEAGFLYRKTIE